MATVSVVQNNTRVDDSEALTGWLGIGGGQGASAEPSFPYQGTNLVNRKVTSSTGAGFYYDPTGDGGSAINMTNSSSNTWVVKCIVTDSGGLQPTNGVQIRIGSGTNAYYEYIVAGSLSPLSSYSQYPARQGLIIIPINPNVVGYRNSTSGSPSLTAVDYFGLLAAFTNSTSKSENVGLDAIDIGTGLTLTGGDGLDTDGNFSDFSDFDEGNTTNRFGYATVSNGIIFCFGKFQIGNTTATGFTDNENQVIFPDGYFDSGWSSIDVDLSNSSTVVNIGNTITSLGTDTVVNTRADLNVTGSSGSFTLNATLNNFRNIILTSSCTVEDALIECSSLAQSNSDISDATIITTSSSGVATLQDPTFGTTTDLHDVTFIQGSVGHALELDTATTYNLTNLFFQGYGSTTSNDAAIFVSATSGTVTINVNGGDTPTYRSAGATVVINNSVNVKVAVLDATTLNPIQDARVLLEADTGGDLSVGTDILIGLTDVNGVIEDTGFNFTNNQPVTGKVRKATTSPFYRQGLITGTITSSGFNTNILLILDE